MNGIGPFGFGRFESFGVAYIQMIQAIMPVLTLVLMFALKLEKSSPTCTKIIISISVGVIIASVGELHSHVVGFCMQAIAACAEAMRLTLVNVLLSSKGLKLDVMSGASYSFPTCAVLISVCCAIFEWDTAPIGTFDKTARAEAGALGAARVSEGCGREGRRRGEGSGRATAAAGLAAAPGCGGRGGRRRRRRRRGRRPAR